MKTFSCSLSLAATHFLGHTHTHTRKHVHMHKRGGRPHAQVQDGYSPHSTSARPNSAARTQSEANAHEVGHSGVDVRLRHHSLRKHTHNGAKGVDPGWR